MRKPYNKWATLPNFGKLTYFENNREKQRFNTMEKGKTNNPNGRPKGTPNKITTDMRGWLTAVIDKNRKQMEKDLKRLEPKDRLQILEKLMQYVIPKQQAVSADIDFGRLTDEQLDAVIDQLTKDIGDEN